MSFIADIKSWLGFQKIKKETGKHRFNRGTVGFDSAKKIGFLFDATDDRNFETMKQYLKDMRGRQKEVHALGYINSRQIPANKFPQYGLNFFCRKDLDWQGIPVNLTISNFIREDFDIVVNLTNHIFPLTYIAAVSRARFRVGKFRSEYVNCYEMMIHSESGSLEQILGITENYLKKLKS
jgi:hypothetical protein